MQISWPEVAWISLIVSVITVFERWLTRYWHFAKQRKKLIIYKVFDGQQPFTSEEILRKLRIAALRHDLEGEAVFDAQSFWQHWRYQTKKIWNRVTTGVAAKTYSVKNLAQLEPLLYGLIQEGMLQTDGEKYFRNR